MKRNPIETLMGAIVIMVALFFVGFAYSKVDMKTVEGYRVTASFTTVGGLKQGSNVFMSGIKIGSVVGLEIGENYMATATLSIRPDVRLPRDTEVSIDSEGLAGDRFIELKPGKSNDFVAEGGRLSNAKSFKSLEDLVGEFIFLATQD